MVRVSVNYGYCGRVPVKGELQSFVSDRERPASVSAIRCPEDKDYVETLLKSLGEVRQGPPPESER